MLIVAIVAAVCLLAGVALAIATIGEDFEVIDRS